jgi:DNA-binding CsgD family transcriptional regulator
LSAIQLVMAENYVNMHKLDSARSCFKAAMESEKKLQAEGYSDLARRGGLEMLKYLLDYESGHHISSITFSRYCDSISHDVRMRRDTEIKQLETKQRLQAVNYELRLKSNRMWWSIVVLLVTVFIASLGVYLYIRNRYYRLAEAENRVDTLTRLVEDAKRSTTDTPQPEDDTFFKKILMKQLGIIKLVASTPTNQNQALLRRISAISEGDIPVDDLISWPDLYPIIDTLYHNFHSQLMVNYGSMLTDKEVKICCLLCASFSTKEIGIVTQQSDATIYVRKSAIRKKLGVDEKQDIIDFINRI